MSYRVKSIKSGVYGTGYHSGRKAVIISFIGCNMWNGADRDRTRYAEKTGALCPLWCNADFTKQGSRFLTASTILAQVKEEAGKHIKFVVLTGGEPLNEIDPELVETLRTAGFYVLLETNGSISMSERYLPENKEAVWPNWITVSPKIIDKDIRLEIANEAIFAMPDYKPQDFPGVLSRLLAHPSTQIETEYQQEQGSENPIESLPLVFIHNLDGTEEMLSESLTREHNCNPHFVRIMNRIK